MVEPDPETFSSGAGQRLGAPETLGISTLDPGHRPPVMPSGRHVTVRVRMLDDTEKLFDISIYLSQMHLLLKRTKSLTLLLIRKALVPIPLLKPARFPPQRAEYQMVGEQKWAIEPICGSNTMLRQPSLYVLFLRLIYPNSV
ncbi:hypothetical protein XENOCAPTIV_010520 [Xenoophorus captivus]|uniref:Uncharacterized protein n=1 Tax=Xenoophorus captivus TaxID=1517983 RepID=A0ABV0SGV4_9TELE